MPAQYRKLYANGSVVAYGIGVGPFDHLFLWLAAAGPNTFDSLDTLLQTWRAAPVSPSGPIGRSILFCQRFDPATLAAALDRLCASPVLKSCWGKFVYWRDDSFNGGAPDASFPDGTFTPVLIANVSLSLNVGPAPRTLDDFAIEPDPSGAGFTLSLPTSPNARWRIDGAGDSTALTVALDGAAQFSSGAVGLAMSWPAAGAAHPLRRVGFAFVGRPSELPGPGGDPAPCRVWTSLLSDQVVAAAGGDSCKVLLDPRDGLAAPTWLRGEMNSRLLFGDGEIHSSFFASNGRRFLLKATDSGAARLGLVYDLMLPDQSVMASGNMTVFHPEGLFEILGPAPDSAPADNAPPLNISSRDLVAGAAATEFFDLNAATHVEFVKRGPAFFVENAGVSSLSGALLDSRGGVVFTSYLRFWASGATATVPYHSQPAEAPLFESQSVTADHLRRYRKQFGTLTAPVPVFPRAGCQDSDTGSDADILRFDTTNLGQYRRNNANAAINGAGARNASNPTASDETGVTLAVTPQGLLADVSNGRYSRLYFGNPDSETVRMDFSIGINDSAGPLYDNLQQALAGNQLFMVFRKPSADALKVVAPAATLYVRDFQFSVGPAGTDGASPRADGASSMSASALIVKYFTGSSISDLLGDTRLWACQSELAPAGNSDLPDWTPFPDGNVPDYLRRLHDIWLDKNWQGVLALDFPVADMPDILKALRPGLTAVPPATVPQLRAQYFGLNVVPARKTDLVPGTTPKRAGSAFGLIRYAKGSNPDPLAPTKGDTEPGASPDPDRSYAFIVDSLRIGFENSQVSAFQAKVLVRFSHLFWDALAPPERDGGNTLELDGQYESRPLPGGGSEDVFSLVSPTPYAIRFGNASYLKQITISRAQLSVVSSDPQSGGLTAFIGIDAIVVLSEKLANVPSFLPLFTVRQIRLSSFGFQFVYQPKTSTFTFGFKADGISADIDFEPGAVASLLSFLPLKMKGMSVAIANLLDLESDLHFQPLLFNGIGTKLHFGFLMDLDLGSLGQLAGSLAGLRVPLLLGWAGGSHPGLAFGIQFPTFNDKIDIGIQQFIRLQADRLKLARCLDATNNLTAVAIQAVNARVVMFGKEWPKTDISFVIFVRINSNRKPSWALGLDNGNWYAGGGYRIQIPGTNARDVKDIVKAFKDQLNDINDQTDVCSLLNKADPASDDWSIAAQYVGAFRLALAVSDPDVYGLDVSISDFDLDLLYRRVNDQLGIFSIEFTLPASIRTMQFGAATIRLPVFRLEIQTDGGFLADFGFPWNNDFSRSAQVEIAIFLGSGGFYFGITSAAASDLLAFTGGYGHYALDPNDPVDSATLNGIRTLRLGFAARVGIGRSFTIGILNAQASLTLFGGLEGAAGYRPGEQNLFNPTLYALKGYMGLMLDIQATVDFAIIRASAYIHAYADVGVEIRRVLGKATAAPGDHTYYLLTLPVVIFADIGLSVGVDVQIHIGCVSVTIHLSFTRTWHFEEALGSLVIHPFDPPFLASRNRFLTLDAAGWDTSYKYWNGQRSLTVYATVLPCLANAADVGESGGPKTCAVGTMLLPVRPADNGFADLARFLAGWVVLPAVSLTGNPDDYSTYRVTLGAVNSLLDQMTNEAFWTGFPPALLSVVKNQFTANLKTLAPSQNEPFALIPPWPDSVFTYVPPGGGPVKTTPAIVLEGNTPMPADKAAFVEYCRHVIAGSLPEVQQLIQDHGIALNPDGTPFPDAPPNDPNKFLTWGSIWDDMLQLS
jgi:hypothetical protein